MMSQPRSLLALAAGLLLLCSVAESAYCSGKPDPAAKPNLNEINRAKPSHVRSVKNGHMYTAGGFNVLHVYGSAYDMGLAQAQLVGPDIKKFVEDTFQYVEDSVVDAINGSVPWLPPKIAQEIAAKGLDTVLDLEVKVTAPFTGEYFNEELKGISDGSGLALADLQRIHLFGELTKGSCSMFGAWGDAVPDDYSLLQLRALDWDMDGPFRNYSQVTVYHPTLGQPFANVGFNGFIGSFSGMSSQHTATAEIGVSFPDATFGKESRKGIPFTYLLRDLLQFDHTLADAKHRFSTANRTCDLILGFGDGKMGETGGFNAVQYSASVANFQTDENQMPNEDWHPRMKNIVYYGMDWNCPSFDRVLHAQLEAGYGKLTPELAIRNVTAIEQSGNLFITYYDLTPSHNKMYVSFAARHGEAGPLSAYDRTFTELDMTELFATPPPQL